MYDFLMCLVYVFFGTLIAFLPFLPFLYLLHRNNVVYKYRLQFLEDDYGEDYKERMRRYYSLPTYNKMLWQLFTFNWDYCWKNKENK
jgi:hypothetical protein